MTNQRDPSASQCSCGPPQPELTGDQETIVFRAAGRRVAETVRGEPRQAVSAALGPAAELPVYGAFVSLKCRGQLRSCCGYLGKWLSLAEAIEHAAVRAAVDDPRFPPIAAAELAELDMDVWLLWGLQTVTAAGEDRVAAVTIGKHGVQVNRGCSRGLLLPSVAVDHRLDARNFLKQVCIKAGLASDAWLASDTKLMTFEGRAIHGRLCTALAAEGKPKNRPPTIDARPPAVAGTFYPAGAQQLQQMLDTLFADLDRSRAAAWPALMAPHAGWVYSGRVAAQVFTRVQAPAQVVILCPRHHRVGSPWAVAPVERWLFPGGGLDGDAALAGRLVEAVDGLEWDDAPHREEHAIEVQLPLLARIAPAARVVGITVGGGAGLEALQRFGRQMADALRGLAERPLLVISSDMNHFADDAATRRLDRLAIDALQTLDPARLYQTVREHRISMCGADPAVVVMEALRSLGGLTRSELVAYATSGDTGGDRHRVVGYAGLLLG